MASMGGGPIRAGCMVAGAFTTRIGSRQRSNGTGASAAIRSIPRVASTYEPGTGARVPATVERPSSR